MVKTLVFFCEVDVEFLDDTVTWVEHHSMDTWCGEGEVAFACPGPHAVTLHAGSLEDIPALLEDVQLHQSAGPLLRIFNPRKLFVVQTVHITDLTNPVFYQPNILHLPCTAHRSTVIMSTHDNMRHFQKSDRVFQNGEKVEVIWTAVSDVAVNEEVAWVEAEKLAGVDSRVGAADVEEAWGLCLAEVAEELRVGAIDSVDPVAVVRNDRVEVAVLCCLLRRHLLRNQRRLIKALLLGGARGCVRRCAGSGVVVVVVVVVTTKVDPRNTPAKTACSEHCLLIFF